MEFLNLLIATASMLAGIGSCYYAYRARKNTDKVVNLLNRNTNIKNKGTNSGVIAGNVSGGVNNVRSK